MSVVPGNVLQYKEDVDVVVAAETETETHLDSEDDRTAVAGVLAVHGAELTDCLVTQSGALKCAHWAALGPEEKYIIFRDESSDFC